MFVGTYSHNTYKSILPEQQNIDNNQRKKNAFMLVGCLYFCMLINTINKQIANKGQI